MTRLANKMIAAAGLLLVPTVAQAHPGVHFQGFSGGLVHPVTGLDHLLAMVAVGFFAAQRGGRSLWTVPMMFLGAMLVAAMVGISGYMVPVTNQVMAATVLIVGLLIVAAGRVPLSAATVVLVLFALFHGYAHGAEMPGGASGWLYSLGFLSMTTVLLGCGVALGIALKKNLSPSFSRSLGGVIALCGVGLFLAA